VGLHCYKYILFVRLVDHIDDHGESVVMPNFTQSNYKVLRHMSCISKGRLYPSMAILTRSGLPAFSQIIYKTTETLLVPSTIILKLDMRLLVIINVIFTILDLQSYAYNKKASWSMKQDMETAEKYKLTCRSSILASTKLTF